MEKKFSGQPKEPKVGSFAREVFMIIGSLLAIALMWFGIAYIVVKAVKFLWYL